MGESPKNEDSDIIYLVLFQIGMLFFHGEFSSIIKADSKTTKKQHRSKHCNLVKHVGELIMSLLLGELFCSVSVLCAFE